MRGPLHGPGKAGRTCCPGLLPREYLSLTDTLLCPPGGRRALPDSSSRQLRWHRPGDAPTWLCQSTPPQQAGLRVTKCPHGLQLQSRGGITWAFSGSTSCLRLRSIGLQERPSWEFSLLQTGHIHCLFVCGVVGILIGLQELFTYYTFNPFSIIHVQISFCSLSLMTYL